MPHNADMNIIYAAASAYLLYRAFSRFRHARRQANVLKYARLIA